MHSAPSAAAVVDEVQLIDAVRASTERPPFQLNAPFEADAEIIDLGGGSLLALTCDTLHAGSELATAATPYARGWLAATATLSDLAAVGARPQALLLSCSFRRGQTSLDDAREIGAGADDVIGGDTNWAGEESFTGCALGLVQGAPIGRVGAEAGDALYVSGPVGAGNAAGVRSVLHSEEASDVWLPMARCSIGTLMREQAKACIDTSDGLVSAALMLADLNGLGFELLDEPAMYDAAALELAASLNLPGWLLAAGEWGEYELLYAVAPESEAACAEAIAARGAAPVRVGQLTAERRFTIRAAGAGASPVDARAIADRLRAVEPGAELLAELLAVVAEERR